MRDALVRLRAAVAAARQKGTTDAEILSALAIVVGEMIGRVAQPGSEDSMARGFGQRARAAVPAKR